MKNELVSKAIEYIIKNLSEEITIEDMADYCHLSKYHLCRVFKAETGEGVYAFIKRQRMEQSAIEMKLGKNKSITDIGMTYGYSSSNYSTAFKKHHHLSPAEFRKAVNVSFVKRRIYFVKDTEGRRLIAEQSEQQGDNRQGPLAA